MNRFHGLRGVLCWLGVVLSTTACSAGDVVEDALRATVRMTAGGKTGTGFFVTVPADIEGQPDRTLLVSAGHTLNEIEGTKCTLVFRVPDAEAGFVRREVDVTVREGDKRLWIGHPQADVAVLPVDLPAGVDVQPFPLRQIAEAKQIEEKIVRVGQDVIVPCFPAQVEANTAGWPILRKGSLATHPLTPVARTPTMYVDYSHFGGDSGAPVVATVNGEPLVVGVVFAMFRITDKTSTTFEERIIHTSLGLAVAVQAPLVRQTIDVWRGK